MTMHRVFVLFCLLLIVPAASAQEPDAPYVYYQSDSALRVERADGTDRHLLTLTEGPIGGEIGWSEWSPSGDWFAWTTIEYDHYGEPGISKPGAVRADGRRVTVLDDYLSAELSWSPTE